MKKILVFLLAIFLIFSCEENKEIDQRVQFDNKTNQCTITTDFMYPDIYSSYVYCQKSQIDSISKIEMDKAISTQKKMIQEKDEY